MQSYLRRCDAAVVGTCMCVSEDDRNDKLCAMRECFHSLLPSVFFVTQPAVKVEKSMELDGSVVLKRQ